MKSQDFLKITLPDAPGVYFFVKGTGIDREVLYIGKATSLSDRVKSYFSADLLVTRGEHVTRMVEDADAIEWERMDSVLEALLREAVLIKKYQPRGNAIGKDDKTFNHVVITSEAFPRILILRGKDLVLIEQGQMARKLTRRDLKWTFGPFTSGGTLKEALKLVRRIFPFRDLCVPCVEAVVPKTKRESHRTGPPSLDTGYQTSEARYKCKPCFNAQIRLCPGVCAGSINRKDYNRTVQHIKLFFDGKKKVLVRELERDMKVFARQQEFEKAAEVKRELEALRHIQDVALLKRDLGGDSLLDERGQGEGHPMSPIFNLQTLPTHGALTPHAVVKAYDSVVSDAGDAETHQLYRGGIHRIEAYDVAHQSGEETVGVMVVVVNGEPEKAAYRQFRIRNLRRGSDTDALREVLERRLAHSEWPLPQLIVVDGGEAQIATAERALRKHFGPDVPTIPLVGVVKDTRHKPREIRGTRSKQAQTTRAIIRDHERSILLANSEAHRFAITFHRKRRRKSML